MNKNFFHIFIYLNIIYLNEIKGHNLLDIIIIIDFLMPNF